MEPRLTLGSLHKGQTSQDQFAGVGAALEALTDIRQSSQLVSSKARGENGLNFLTFLPQVRKEKGSPWSVAHWTPVAWLVSGGTKCQLPIGGGSGHPMNLINSKISRARGGCAPFEPLLKRGDTPLFNNPPPVWFSGGCAPKNGHFFLRYSKNANNHQKSWIKAYFTLPKVKMTHKGVNSS